MKQCTLERNGARQVSWIPATKARLDHVVDLKEDGEWSRGWTVTQVGEFELSSEVVQERGRDFKTHRRGTDI